MSRTAWILLALLGVGAPHPALSQNAPRMTITLPAPATRDTTDPPAVGPAVAGPNVIANGQIRDLLRSGFPARLRFHLELWRKGSLFDQLLGSADWQIVVRYDPLTKRYRAARIKDNVVTVLGDFDQPPQLDSAIAQPYIVPLPPRDRQSRYYYTGTLDVEMISLNDLDEVERWLRGELSPAVRGQRNPSGVIGRGLRGAFLKLIGAEQRHYEARTKVFRAG
ncbi:MAG TPA: DUF4390 domain-containing protein [Gemmatimonadaceae bacterium]|nr:DUF4390 domain-containing protein [Gemmatimonadaceae bacterium]